MNWSWRKIAVGATFVVVALVGAVAARKWIWPSGMDRRPNSCRGSTVNTSDPKFPASVAGSH